MYRKVRESQQGRKRAPWNEDGFGLYKAQRGRSHATAKLISRTIQETRDRVQVNRDVRAVLQELKHA